MTETDTKIQPPSCYCCSVLGLMDANLPAKFNFSEREH